MGILDRFRKPKVEVIDNDIVSTKSIIYAMPRSLFKWDNIDVTGDQRLITFYESVWNVYRCITLICRTFSTLPFQLIQHSTSVTGGEKEITDHPVLNLLKYKCTPIHSGVDFLEAISTYLLISGLSYGQVVGFKDNPDTIWPIPSQFMEIVPGDRLKPIKKYKYNDGKTQRDFEPDEIFYNFYFNPHSMIGGLSPLGIARRKTITQEKTEMWNQNLLSNNANPSAILSFQRSLSEPQREKLEKDIDEKWVGVDNAGKVHVIEGSEMQVHKLSFPPKDLDWLQSQKMTLRAIGQVFGVDSSLLGDGENKTYSNMKEAKAALYTDTVIPLAEKIFRTISFYFFWNPTTRRMSHSFRIKKEDIEVLKINLKETTDALKGAWWLTGNRKLEIMGMALSDEPIMDKILIPSNLIPADELGGGFPE